MKALCKKSYQVFKKNNYYKINSIHSVFETNDFITIESDKSVLYRFRLNQSLDYIDDYIGKNEVYFHDYFININNERKNKLKFINCIYPQ